MARELHDHYFRQAKRDGYVSRAAYKLMEIDDRRELLRAGDRVLDCGATPGSWMQVALKRVGRAGCVVGVDLKPITYRFAEPNARVVQSDLATIPGETLLTLADEAQRADAGSTIAAGRVNRRLFDVILSDMAPSTSGEATIDHHGSVRLCDMVLDRCRELLRPGGNVCMKVFEGEAYRDLLERSRAMFETARGFAPKASRSESREIYIIARGWTPGSGSHRSDGAAPRQSQEPCPPPPRPRPTTPPRWRR